MVGSHPQTWGSHCSSPASLRDTQDEPLMLLLHAKSLQSFLTLCNPMDSSPPGSSVHRILQARILEWVAMSFSKNKV